MGVVYATNSLEEIPAVGGQYTEAVVGSPEFINPIFAPLNDVDQDIARLVYSGLLAYDEHQNLVSDLAERYEESEDKKVYTFFLRQGVVWHDGEPFTAHDVAFTFETIQNPAINSPLRVAFEGVGVEALDDDTVRFTLSETFSPFLASLTVGILPEHIWFGISEDRIRLAQQNLRPVGTGPFAFKDYFKDDIGQIHSFTLKRFDRFYREPAFIEEVVFRFFADYDGPDGAIAAIREQKVDGLSFVPYDLRERVERKHVILHTLRLPQYTALFFNQERQPILQDADVRFALAAGLDKERIVRESLKGEGQTIDGPILPGSIGFHAEIPRVEYSLDRANEALDKTWKRMTVEEYRAKRKAALAEQIQSESENAPLSAPTTTDGGSVSTSTPAVEENDAEIEALLDAEINQAQTFYRQNDAGAILHLTVVTADRPEYRQAAGLIVGFWQDMGIETSVRYVSPKDISRDVLKTREYDVLLYGIILGSDPDQFAFWHSSQVNFPGLNVSGYVNRAVDAILEEIRATTDQAKVTELYVKFQEAILSDRPAIFLYTPIYTYVTSDDIQGIQVEEIFMPSDRFAGMTHWYMKTKKTWKRASSTES